MTRFTHYHKQLIALERIQQLEDGVLHFDDFSYRCYATLQQRMDADATLLLVEAQWETYQRIFQFIDKKILATGCVRGEPFSVPQTKFIYNSSYPIIGMMVRNSPDVPPATICLRDWSDFEPTGDILTPTNHFAFTNVREIVE